MKITIKALKQYGIYREPLLHLRNSVRQTFRAARQWRRVCSTRRRKKNQQQGEIRNSFLPSSFLAGGDLQNNQKTQPAVLFSPDLFSDFFFLF
jgi:hypothetical protein